MLRRLALLSITLLAILLIATPALAGGWAVISLDNLPAEVFVDQPLTVGFKVLQHGKTPMAGLDPEIRLINPNTGEDLIVFPTEEGDIGHYSATFNLPESGNWRWSIRAFTMDQPMPDLVVAELPKQAISNQKDSAFSSLPSNPLIIGIAGLTFAGLGMAYLLMRRSRWVIFVIIVGLLIGVAGIAQASIGVASESASETNQSKPIADPINQIKQGEDLFIAKGCVSCHINRRIDQRYRVFSTEIGPDLTSYPTSSEYLHLWLANPPAVKPATMMPNLGLSPDEIDALTAFLLQDRQN